MTASELILGSLAKAYPDLSQDELRAVLSEWEVIPYEQDGELVGAACMKGTEFHCMTLPQFQLRREEMREFARPLFERFGVLTTRLQHGDTANRRFNRLFGFKETWADDRFRYFEMAELPFSKEQTCQQ